MSWLGRSELFAAANCRATPYSASWAFCRNSVSFRPQVVATQYVCIPTMPMMAMTPRKITRLMMCWRMRNIVRK